MTDRDGSPDSGPSEPPPPGYPPQTYPPPSPAAPPPGYPMTSAYPPPSYAAPPSGYPAAPVGHLNPSVAAGAPAPGRRTAQGATRVEWRARLRAAALIVLVLAVVGALLGILWAWWSPPVPAGEVLRGGLLRDEKEGFVAADGRFVVITASVGLVAGIGLWFVRAQRGPVTAVALGVGGLVGSILTALVGYLVGGGTTSAPVGTIIPHLSLEVQMHGVYLFEAIIAVLAYAILVAFAAADDLGRPDPFHDDARARRRSRSVGPEGSLQDPGSHGNGAGLPQQHDLSA